MDDTPLPYTTLVRSPGVVVDAGRLERCVVGGLDVLDRQVECEIRSILAHPVLPSCEVAQEQVLAELLPFALGEDAIVVAAGVALRKVVGHGAWHVVVTDDNKREQTVSIAVFMLRSEARRVGQESASTCRLRGVT